MCVCVSTAVASSQAQPCYALDLKRVQGPDRDRLMRQVLDSAKAELRVSSELSAVYSAVVSGFAKCAR